MAWFSLPFFNVFSGIPYDIPTSDSLILSVTKVTVPFWGPWKTVSNSRDYFRLDWRYNLIELEA